MLPLFSNAVFALTYSVVPILPPSGMTGVQMSGINDSGQVAGYGFLGPNVTQAFIGSPSGSLAIPLPAGWTSTQAVAINSAGQVAGTAANSTSKLAFIGTQSGVTFIPLPTGPMPTGDYGSAGTALNDSGQVAGTLYNLEGQEAFVGNASGLVSFLLGGPQTTVASSGINRSGIVAGTSVYSYFLSGSAGVVSFPSAFVGTPAGTTSVAPPPGWGQASGYAINVSGQVAGVAWMLGSLFELTNPQAFVYAASGTTLIPLPTGASVASVGQQSINSSGVVVGQSNAGGWIWDPVNGTRLLNALVPPGWNVTSGVSISDRGLILAQASYQGGASQYVELTAAVATTATPSTLGLALIGIALCSAWWAQREQTLLRR